MLSQGQTGFGPTFVENINFFQTNQTIKSKKIFIH